ncbi:hypothetical protein BVG79_00173 [Ketogulonicigenium robustum]|uniref:Uncharacterized protein n=1 Tax=Ketogulonicigenium robustum TaxID=92947 RepID=A0A1W6NWL5_9RHOB|nr:hypothetical protein BVG79_00173 [Ketogulonicigenium robustum]
MGAYPAGDPAAQLAATNKIDEGRRLGAALPLWADDAAPRAAAWACVTG